MTSLQAIIPDDIHEAVLAQAGREPIPRSVRNERSDHQSPNNL